MPTSYPDPSLLSFSVVVSVIHWLIRTIYSYPAGLLCWHHGNLIGLWNNPNYNMTVWISARNDINFSMAAGLIVLFHKSQCALRYLDLMSKIQNISSHRSLGTCLTVTANERNGDWPAPVSRVSMQPVIGWLKYEVARQWSHIVHRPRPHGNVTLPMRS